VAQDFQVSNSGSWEPLVLEPPWNPPLKNFYVENKYFDLEDGEKKYFNPSDLLQSRIENTTKMKISNLIWSM
jgi:hypothetical protein